MLKLTIKNTFAMQYRNIFYFIPVFSSLAFQVSAQTTGNQNPNYNINQQVNTNIGNNFQINNSDISNNNLVAENNAAPAQQQQYQIMQQAQAPEINNSAEQKEDKSFHLNLNFGSNSLKEHNFISSQAYSKTKTTKSNFAKRKFMRKQRIKKWFPKKKIKYNTSLCGQF